MAIKLSNKPNVEAPNPTYPFGQINDNDGSDNGTPVNRLVYGDMHQFFEALMLSASIAFNNLPDNAVNGFQLIDALIKVIRITYATETESGTLEIATQAETITGTDDGRIVTPKKLQEKLDNVFGAWTLRSDISDVTASGGSGIVVNACNIKYKILGKVMHMIVSFHVQNTTAPNFFFIKLPNSKVSNVGFATQDSAAIYDDSQQKLGNWLIANGSGFIQARLAFGDSFTNGTSASVFFTATLEIA